MTVAAAEPEPAATADRKPARGRWPRLGTIALAAVSGVALYLSFAPRTWWWLAPLAFAGLGVALAGRTFWGRFGCGFLFGLAFLAPLLTWLREFLGSGFGPWPWLALSATLALYYALAAGLTRFTDRLPAAPIFHAALFVAIETPLAWVPLGGFPWGRIAFTQPEGAFLSLASLGGAPLVGFAVALTGFGLAALVLRLRAHQPRTLIAAGVVTALPVLTGLAAWPTVGTDAQAGSLTVAAVQGNAPDEGLAMLGEGSGLSANHFAESARLLQQNRHPELVVWPETATTIRGDDPRLDQLVNAFGVPALIGAAYERVDGSLENSVVVWNPGTGQGERYIKQQLVPFGEYVPMRSVAQWVTPFVGKVDERVRGDGEPAALDAAGTRIGVMICYEAAYDYPARDAVRAGATLLTAPTNNAWYGRSEMTYQQLAMSRLRAVEHGRAVVVAATSGVSAIVRPDGSVSQSTGMFTAASLVERVPLRTQTTLADRLGAVIEYGLVVLAVAGTVAGIAMGRRTNRTAEAPRDTAEKGP